MWWRAFGLLAWKHGPMRSIGTATLLLILLAVTGCGSGGGDADDVPTITTRPSTPASSVPTTPTTVTSEPAVSTSATVEPTTEPAPTPTESDPLPTETAGPSPEPPTDEPVGPTTYRQASARIRDAGPPIASVARFSTGGDLVYCLLDDPVIGPSCELSRGFVEDDDVCGGAAEGVGRIETFDGRARPVCPTDTIREPGARVIRGDGVVSDGGGVRCLVDGTGVTCIDASVRTGFFLAPREYHVF